MFMTIVSLPSFWYNLSESAVVEPSQLHNDIIPLAAQPDKVSDGKVYNLCLSIHSGSSASKLQRTICRSTYLLIGVRRFLCAYCPHLDVYTLYNCPVIMQHFVIFIIVPYSDKTVTQIKKGYFKSSKMYLLTKSETLNPVSLCRSRA